MARVTAYRGYMVMSLAQDLRAQLDPAIFNRLIHEGPQTNAEAEDIISQLVQLKESIKEGA